MLGYPGIAERLAALTRHPALGENKTLVIDATGVGRPIRDLLSRARLGCPFYAVNITGGGHQHQSEGVTDGLVFAAASANWRATLFPN